MKAIMRAKIFGSVRTPLETVIPLETPFSVEIDVCSLCNFKCRFCFHSDTEAIKNSGIRHNMMSMDLYMKIIDDLKEFPNKVKKLKLFEFGEPLLNKNLPKMIQYAIEQNIANEIEFTTNAALLNPDLNIAIIEAGISRINISVEALSSEKYKEMTGTEIDFDQFVCNIRNLYENKKDCYIYIKLADLNLDEAEKQIFYDTFGDICDEIYIENISPMWKGTTAEFNTNHCEEGSYGQKVKEKDVCTFLFTRMVINSDGTVVACCVDWERQLLIGDVKFETMKSIWKGKKLRELQIAHLRREKSSIPLCSKCSALMTSTVDNIDAYAEMLALKLYGNETED